MPVSKKSLNPHDYLESFKKQLLLAKDYPAKFKNLAKLVDFLLSPNSDIINLNRGVYFNFKIKDCLINEISLENINEYVHFINLYLEFVGFKKIVKDYVLISSYTLKKNGEYTSNGYKIFTEDVAKEKGLPFSFLYISFYVLFNDNNKHSIEENTMDFYFNSKLFTLGVTKIEDAFYTIRFEEFTESFFSNFFEKFYLNPSLKLSDCLNLEYFRQIEKQSLEELQIIYTKFSRALFTKSYEVNSIYGLRFFNEKDFFSGELEKEENSFFFNRRSFFKTNLLWVNFALSCQNNFFNDSSIINSEVNVDYVGNCNYILKSLE